MNIGLIDVDGHHFPNLALMKISAYHKANGDTVDWYSPLLNFLGGRLYASKVFTFSADWDYFPVDWDIRQGGTGYRIYEDLPQDIDDMLPDYSIYPQYDFAIGFLSRGCIRKCPWCVVPRKEGNIRQYDDIERVSQGRKEVVLMDNNFLANDFEFIKEQLEKSIALNIRIDFNQALDARLVNDDNAKLLAKAKWSRYIRFACDTESQIEPVIEAIKTVRNAGYTKEFMCYFLAKEVDETLERINKVMQHDKKFTPYVMPYRNLDGDGEIINDNLKRLARWCNRQWLRKSCKFEDYKG